MLQNPILQIVVAQHYTEAVVFAFYTKCKQFQEIVYVSFFSCGWNISLPFFVLQQFSSPPWLHFILAPPYSSFLEIFFSWQNNTTRVVPNLKFPNFDPTNQYDKSNFAWTFEKKFRLHNWTMSSGILRVYKKAHLKMAERILRSMYIYCGNKETQSRKIQNNNT